MLTGPIALRIPGSPLRASAFFASPRFHRTRRPARALPLRAVWLFSLIYLAALGPLRLRAVVDAASTANTNAPADGAPWANVVSLNGASGVYLGSGWVATAAHVGLGNPIFDSAAAGRDGAGHRLTNSDGSLVDMQLFHLSNAPALPTLALAGSTPATLSVVDLIGYGRIRGSDETTISNHPGFYWSSAGYKSWGNCRISEDGLTSVDDGVGVGWCVPMDFVDPASPGPPAPTSDEAEAAGGDSGGGVFQQTGSGWRLVGMIIAIDLYTNQPWGTAAYGNTSYAVDIASYRDQVLGLMGASAVPVLSISRAGTAVRLGWPDSAAGCTLESTTNLQAPAWSTVVENVASTNGQGGLAVPLSGGARFFRLRQP